MPLTLSAPSEHLLHQFLARFNPVPNTYNDRWHILSLLVDHEIDWPLWHEHHERVFNERRASAVTFDPWLHDSDYPPAVAPMDFRAIMRSLVQLCGRHSAGRYSVLAWHSVELIEPELDKDESQQRQSDLAFLCNSPATVSAANAPLEKLFAFAKRSDYVHAFRAAGVARPASNEASRALVLAAGDDSPLARELRAAPRWREARFLCAPHGFSWGQFQDFRFLAKCMASDLANYFSGFPVFTPR